MKPPIRRAHGAELVHVTRQTVWSWRATAMATPDLSGQELAILGTIAMRIGLGRVPGISHRDLAKMVGGSTVECRWTVDRLVERGLLAVQAGRGTYPNRYLPCLPRKVASAVPKPVELAGLADDLIPPC